MSGMGVVFVHTNTSMKIGHLLGYSNVTCSEAPLYFAESMRPSSALCRMTVLIFHPSYKLYMK